MENTGLIKINGVDVSDFIVTYSINAYDLHDQDSGDAENGFTYVNIVRKDKIQIELGWSNITSEYKNKILKSIESGCEIPVDLTYSDTEYDKHVELTYRGDRKVELVGFSDDKGSRIWNLSFNLIEQ